MGSYIPATAADREKMLAAIGVKSARELFRDVPESLYRANEPKLGKGLSEMETRLKIERLAAKNAKYATTLRGAGAYRHYIPAIVPAIVNREEFATAYTPYQAEISQGILQSIFEYQTMICELTGMDVSNASVYDGATAAAEAVSMCRERGRTKAIVSACANPQYIETIRTYCFASNADMVLVPERDGVTDADALREALDGQTACVLLQQPNFFGLMEDARRIGEIAHAAGAKFVLSVNPIALAILPTPAEYGADVAIGEGQPLGMELNFGGPYLGFMATKTAFARKLPGRIVGQTVDAEGKTGYVLTLTAREQHIRREKASSNICSNEALCALTAAAYLSAMGADGLKKAASNSHSKACYFASELEKIGLARKHGGEFFHEFVTACDGDAGKRILSALSDIGVLGGLPVDGGLLWCVTELVSKEEIDLAVSAIREVL